METQIQLPNLQIAKPTIRYLMNPAIKKANDYSSAANKVTKMLKGYNVVGNIAALPDFTDSNTLPIGTTAVITPEYPINPAFIGMDIGCGYSFFSMPINPKKFHKKGKLKTGSVETLVKDVDQAIKNCKRTDDKELGTIGKGNHFIDMFVIESLYDPKSCEEARFDENQIYFMIHSGSRSRGFNINSHFSGLFKEANINPKEFNQSYLQAFEQAKEYARQNREALRKIIEQALGSESQLFYDKPHNDIEIQENGNLKLKKGTSSLEEKEFFVIPGTCTDSAYAITGCAGLRDSNYTINHGCGRKYTRSQLLSRFRRSDLSEFFKEISLNAEPRQMIEELPVGYKKIEDIINSVEEFNLAQRIAKLRPIGIIVDRGENHGKK